MDENEFTKKMGDMVLAAGLREREIVGTQRWRELTKQYQDLFKELGMAYLGALLDLQREKRRYATLVQQELENRRELKEKLDRLQGMLMAYFGR